MRFAINGDELLYRSIVRVGACTGFVDIVVIRVVIIGTRLGPVALVAVRILARILTLCRARILIRAAFSGTARAITIVRTAATR